MPAVPRLLYVTDLAYQARGRRYADEDLALSALLRPTFDVALADPRQAARLMDAFDVVVVRNSGPVIHYADEYAAFRRHALETGARVFNPLVGRADMAGKGYLAELFASGYPVIPTVDRDDHLDRLPDVAAYVVKPMWGADSVGMRIVAAGEIPRLDGQVLAQPRVTMTYEVSFYFIDRQFHYALYAPDPDRRWELTTYDPSRADLAFAQRFVDWNSLDHGIQRVDAARTVSGDLLLVELEDLNPYLSLDRVDTGTRDGFVSAMTSSLQRLLAG